MKSVVAITVFVLVGLVAPRLEAAKAPVGFWQCSAGQQRVYLAILPNGRLSFDGAAAIYRVAGSALKVQQQGQWVSYPFRLRKAGLTVTMPGNRSLGCRRVSLKGASRLRGMLCSWSGSSSSYAGTSSASTTRVVFDGKGGLRYASENTFSGPGGRHAGGSGTKTGMYRVVGNTILLVFPDGSGGAARVHIRQRSGLITEVKYQGTLFATQLCK